MLYKDKLTDLKVIIFIREKNLFLDFLWFNFEMKPTFNYLNFIKILLFSVLYNENIKK